MHYLEAMQLGFSLYLFDRSESCAVHETELMVKLAVILGLYCKLLRMRYCLKHCKRDNHRKLNQVLGELHVELCSYLQTLHAY